MSIPYRFRPSMGFVLLCLAFGITIKFFVWGLKPPLLDRVWKGDLALRTGKIVSMPDSLKEDLASAFKQHNDLATGLLDGGAFGQLNHTRDEWLTNDVGYLLRTEEAVGAWTLELTTRFFAEEYPLQILLNGPSTHRTFTIQSAGVERFAFSIDKPEVELIELRVVSGKRGSSKRPTSESIVDGTSGDLRVRMVPPGGSNK